MRIISGKYKGKIIHPPRNLPVRPTTDFAKTGLFNILENRYDLSKLSCLDLFSGTGNISLELISRGCKQVTAIDQNKECIHFLKDTASKLGITNLTVIRSEVITFIHKNKNSFDLIFVDPPFDSDIRETLCETIRHHNTLNKNGVLIVEHLSGEEYHHITGFDFSRKYGNVSFSFFSNLVPSQPLYP